MFTNTKAAIVSTSVVRSLSYKELDILHCLRGFCAFYVVIYHAKYILWAGGTEYMAMFPRINWDVWQYLAFMLDMSSSAGYEMVIFFFVLSGFFIRYAQLRKHRKPKAFYLNRVTRIYPPYLASILLALVVLYMVVSFVPHMLNTSINRELNTSLSVAWDDFNNLGITGAIRTLLFLPVRGHLYLGYNSVYWSLLPEAMFYLLVPLAFWRIRLYYFVSILFYLIGIVVSALHYELSGILAFLFIYNFYFAVGAILHDVIIHTKWLLLVRYMPKWLLCMVMIILSIILIPLALLKLKVFSGLIAVVLAVFSVSALLAGRVSNRNIMLRLFHPVGIFSFSLYLYHFPLLIACSALLTSLTGNLVIYTRYYWLAIPIVTIGCYILYWLTERPSVNFFRKT